MKFTNEQICIVGLFLIAAGSLISLHWLEGTNYSTIVNLPASVVSGILGYIVRGDKKE